MITLSHCALWTVQILNPLLTFDKYSPDQWCEMHHRIVYKNNIFDFCSWLELIWVDFLNSFTLRILKTFYIHLCKDLQRFTKISFLA